MEPINQGTNFIQNFFSSFWAKLMAILPDILGAILLIIIGWGIAKIMSIAIKKLLKSIRFDSLGVRFLDRTSLKVDQAKVKPSEWVGIFAFWVIFLLFFVSASETLGWTRVSESINDLVNYLPQLFSALLIFAVGLYLGSFLRSFINTTFSSLNLSGGKILSEITFYTIVIIIATMALQQAGIETTVITANISIILGGILLAFAIGFGYSSRDLLTNILSSFYAKNIFSEGQIIKIDNMEGKITRITNIQTIITTKDGELIIPTKRLISENIERIKYKKPTKTKANKQPATK
jgi:hypothetical protein